MSEQEGLKIERILAPTPVSEDENPPRGIETGSIRPTRFDDYPGQSRVTANLKVYVEAALKSGRPLDHVILHGPPGLGKTTLARIIAGELGSPFYHTSGPAIDKAGDLAGILTGLEAGSLIFIDEIHRLPIAVEEVLYSAMEDFVIDLQVGQGPTARMVRMPIEPFTLIGATTRLSLLSRPMLSRFGIQERLEFYADHDLSKIIQRSARLLGLVISDAGALELAMRSRGTPRIANRLLRRVRDFAIFEGKDLIDGGLVASTLGQLEIDRLGLDQMDRTILETILERYSGGPVGIEALAASVGEERATIEDVHEPFLVHRGFIARGPRGRELTTKGIQHIKPT